MRYRMIAVDLDGTLLNREGTVSKENLAALHRARDAGVMVVPCTGRGWRESKYIVDDLGLDGDGVFVTGAAVANLHTGRTIDIAEMEPHLVLEIIEHLRDMPEAVLVYHDRNRVGHDYLITGDGELTPNTQWWFEFTGSALHYQRRVTEDDLHHALRVGLVAGPTTMQRVNEHLGPALAGRVFMHSFAAIQRPDPEESVHILEIFAHGVDKWRGVRWLADQHGIADAEIAAIGDEINDVALLAAAGCGVAMANAIPAARDAADRVTEANDAHGVAHAIHRMLDGAW